MPKIAVGPLVIIWLGAGHFIVHRHNVKGVYDHSGARDAVMVDDLFPAIPADEGDAIARPYAAIAQCVRDAIGELVEFAVGDRTARRYERRLRGDSLATVPTISPGPRIAYVPATKSARASRANHASHV